ncbi:MAG: hypothetical protein D6748_09855 [Calditrichaeota bacterium]|nr:MAG: hypothetical protein D6748_09855 [Calditrichota bacterium]
MKYMKLHKLPISSKICYFFLLVVMGIILPGKRIIAQETRTLLVEKVQIEGNSKTRTEVIQNYLNITEGQEITREQLQAAKSRLEATNFFKNVEMNIRPGSLKGRAIVTVKVKERYWPYFQFKSGFNELDGWYLSPFGIRFDNLFGRGNRFGLEYLIGDRISGLQLEYVRPYLWGTEYDLQIRIRGFNRDFVHFLNDSTRTRQNIIDNEFMVRLSGNSGIPQYFSIAWISQNVEADSFLTQGENQPPLPSYLLPFAGKKELRRYLLAVSIDTRDRRLSPRMGWWGSISFEQSSKQLGSFVDYTRIVLDIRRYQPVYKDLIGAVRFKWGRVGESAPFYDKFYLGGPNSLRGYEDRGLTPPGYAAQIIQTSAELRFPLSFRKRDKSPLIGVLFYDSGSAWNSPTTLNTTRFHSGAGFGLRIKLPIVGLLRMDFAYPIPEGEFQLHFSLGHTF